MPDSGSARVAYMKIGLNDYLTVDARWGTKHAEQNSALHDRYGGSRFRFNDITLEQSLCNANDTALCSPPIVPIRTLALSGSRDCQLHAFHHASPHRLNFIGIEFYGSETLRLSLQPATRGS